MAERYQKEIEEILEHVGESKVTGLERAGRLSIWSLVWFSIRRLIGGKTWSLSSGRIMVAAIILLLFATIARASVPGLVVPIALTALLLFVVAYCTFFIRPRRVEKRWRGQPLEDSDESDSWWGRLRRKSRWP